MRSLRFTHVIQYTSIELSETRQTFSLCFFFSCFFKSTEAEEDDGRPPEKEIRNTELDRRSSNESLTDWISDIQLQDWLLKGMSPCDMQTIKCVPSLDIPVPRGHNALVCPV